MKISDFLFSLTCSAKNQVTYFFLNFRIQRNTIKGASLEFFLLQYFFISPKNGNFYHLLCSHCGLPIVMMVHFSRVLMPRFAPLWPPLFPWENYMGREHHTRYGRTLRLCDWIGPVGRFSENRCIHSAIKLIFCLFGWIFLKYLIT